jgi:WD repeat-containing protein 55
MSEPEGRRSTKWKIKIRSILHPKSSAVRPPAAASIPARCFQYPTILEPRQIRLVSFQKDGNSQINFRFHEHALDDRSMTFIAMSYFWGDPTPTHRIWSPDQEYIEMNGSAARMIDWLAREEWGAWYWIDAICIDQNNLDEKGQQIPLMRDVYSKAEEVYAYLGGDSESVKKGFSFIVRSTQLLMDDLREGDEENVSMDKLLAGLRRADYDRSFWNGAIELLDNPWFERIWVMQEVVLAKNVKVWRSGSAVDYSTIAIFISMIEHLGGTAHLSISDKGTGYKRLPRAFDQGSIAFSWIQMVKEGHHPSLETCLESSAGLKATNPRDKIYGIMSIAEAAEVAHIVPDYKMPVAELYTSVIKGILLRNQSLALLSSAGIGQENPLQPGLPSWVLDLESPSTSFVFEGQVPFSSSGTTQPQVKKTSNPMHISLVGRLIDKITDLCDPYPANPESVQNQSASEWKQYQEATVQWHQQTTQFVSGSKDLEIYWKLMVANRINGSPPEFSYKRYLDVWFDVVRTASVQGAQISLDHVERPADDPHFRTRVDQTREAFYAFGKIARLFSTQTGGFGMGPVGCQRGDVVVIFHGASTPFLLRPVVSSGLAQHYELVGSCYVHGMMDGEGLALREPEEVTLV